MKRKITLHQQIILLFVILTTLSLIIIFGITSNIFNKNAKNDLKTIYTANINELGSNLDSIFDNALDLSLYPLTEQSLRNYLSLPEASATLQERLSKQRAANTLNSLPYNYTVYIHDIGLYREDGDGITSNSNVKMNAADYEYLKNMSEKPYWDFSHCEASVDYIYLLRHLKNPADLSKDFGYIKIAIPSSKLKNIMTSTQKGKQISYFLITPNDQMVVWNKTEQAASKWQNEITYKSLSSKLSEGESSWLYHSYIISEYKLKNNLILYSITQPEVFNKIKRTFLLTMGIAVILVFSFTLLLSFYFSRLITAPIERLGKHMNKLSEEQFSDRIPVEGCHEIQTLSENYNRMAERLEFLYNEVYMGEIKLKQSRLDALQTQINPHFLYNTLDTIYWMSKMGNSEMTSIMVSNLSKMMRMTLEPQGENDMIPLKRELEHLSCYLTIQQIRYGEKIHFSIACEESLKELSVLSFLLQPLVENALVHGLSKYANGIVKIHILKQCTCLIYEIANNGEPIDVAEINQLLNADSHEMRGLAIRNINERIHLKFGDPYGLTCYLDGEFSVFRITHPLIDTIPSNRA